MSRENGSMTAAPPAPGELLSEPRGVRTGARASSSVRDNEPRHPGGRRAERGPSRAAGWAGEGGGNEGLSGPATIISFSWKIGLITMNTRLISGRISALDVKCSPPVTAPRVSPGALLIDGPGPGQPAASPTACSPPRLREPGGGWGGVEASINVMLRFPLSNSSAATFIPCHGPS